LMVVAIFASSCNKYADDFKQLNTKLDAVASSVAGLTQLATDLAATKAAVTSLQSAVAALPTSASVTAVSTSLTAVSGKVDAISTSLAAVAATGTANATAIAGVKTDLAALVASQATANAAITKGFADDLAKMTALGTSVTDIVAKLVAIAAQETALGTAVAASNTAIAANAAALTALAAQASDLATSVAALTTADAAGFAAAATANAALATQAATIIADITANTSADAVTALVIAGLKTDLAAANATLAVINANTIKTITAPTIAGTVIRVGIELTASPGTALETVTYQWQIATVAGGSTFADITGATTSKYTPVLADLGKALKVKATGTGSYVGPGATPMSVLSTATGVVLAQLPLQAIAATTSATVGLYSVGIRLTAGDLTPTVLPGATATYQWVSSATQYGTYLPISGATSSTYTPVAADATMYIAVVATGNGGYYNTVTSTAVGPINYVGVTSPAFTMSSANNTVTITLTGGTFKTVANGLVASMFTFTGLDAASFATSSTVIFNRVSSTVVTFTKYAAAGFNVVSSETVTVGYAALATQATSVAAVPSTEVLTALPTAIVGTAIGGVTAPVAGATPVTTITAGTGFTGTVSWSGSPVTFAYATAYTATITLTPATGYTTTGIAANSFSVTGATVTNSINSGTIVAVFPATALAPIDIAAVPMVLPIVGAGMPTTISTAQYTGSIAWAASAGGNTTGSFSPANVYTATITLTPATGYTVIGTSAALFTNTGATSVTHTANSNTIVIVYPATASIIVSAQAIAGLTAPVIAATAVTTTTAGTGFTGAVTWTGLTDVTVPQVFIATDVPVATVVLTAAAGYTFTGVAATGAFTVAGAASVTYVLTATTATLTVTYAVL